MNFKEITNLIKLINESDLSEFKMKEKDFEIIIRTSNFRGKAANIVQSSAPQVVQVTAATPGAINDALPASTSSSETETEGLLEVKSPIVGTFYRSTSPDKPPYVKVGDRIEKGDTVCIVEAMKLFNEIESEVSGTIVKVMIEDAAPVEYDKVLFLVDPS